MAEGRRQRAEGRRQKAEGRAEGKGYSDLGLRFPTILNLFLQCYIPHSTLNPQPRTMNNKRLILTQSNF